jgi:DNA mismatch endonuclease (patch repair protein)
MPDTFSKTKRGQIMSKIKSKNTNLEIDFKKLVKGFRLRHQPKIFGNPDFASKKFRVAIFIDSCFWHKCPKHFRPPNSNKTYWDLKISRNVERAKKVNSFLKKDKWKIIHFWEHEIKRNPEKCLSKIKEVLG